GGEILDPQPPRVAVRSEASLDRCRRLDEKGDRKISGSGAPKMGTGAFSEAVVLMVEEAGRSGFPVRALVSRLGLDPAVSERVISQLEECGLAVQVGDVLAAPRMLADLKRS